MKNIFLIILILAFNCHTKAMEPDPPVFSGSAKDKASFLLSTQQWFNTVKSGMFKGFFDNKVIPNSFPDANNLINDFNQWKKLNTTGDKVDKKIYENVVNKNKQLELLSKGINEQQIKQGMRDQDILNALNTVEKLEGSNFTKIETVEEHDKTIHVHAVNEKGEKKEIAIFKNLEQANTFAQIQAALKGQTAMGTINNLQTAIEKILNNTNVMQNIEQWFNDNIHPENLILLFSVQQTRIINSNNKQTLYECDSMTAITIKIAYTIIYNFRKNPNGHKALGFDPTITKKIEEINNTLGVQSLDESLETLKSMKDLKQKLEQIKKESNNLQTLIQPSSNEFVNATEITKMTIAAFEKAMHEKAGSGESTANQILADINKLSALLMQALDYIQLRDKSGVEQILPKVCDIVNKYAKVADITLKKIMEPLENLDKVTDLYTVQKKFDSLFLDSFSMKVANFIKEDVTVDKDPMYSLIRIIDVYSNHFAQLMEIGLPITKDKDMINKYLIAKKKAIYQKIDAKNKDMYNQYKPILEQQVNLMRNNSNAKPIILDLLAKDNFAILVLEKETKKQFRNFKIIQDSFKYLSNDQRKAAFAYFYEIIQNFSTISQKYSFMSRRAPRITVDDIQELLISAKNSIDEQTTGYNLGSNTAEYHIDLQYLKDLVSGDVRKKSLKTDIDTVYQGFIKNLGEFSYTGLDQFITNLEKQLIEKPQNIEAIQKNILITNSIKSIITEFQKGELQTIDSLIKNGKEVIRLVEMNTSFIIEISKFNKDNPAKDKLEDVFNKLSLKFKEIIDKETFVVGNNSQTTSSLSNPPPLSSLLNPQPSSSLTPPPLSSLLNPQPPSSSLTPPPLSSLLNNNN